MIEDIAKSDRWTEIYSLKLLFAMLGVFSFIIPLNMALSFEIISVSTFHGVKGFIVGITILLPTMYLLDKDEKRRSELIEKGKKYEEIDE
jgi:hypothetical protein